jgi:pilus assembly protein Flp/PilA
LWHGNGCHQSEDIHPSWPERLRSPFCKTPQIPDERAAIISRDLKIGWTKRCNVKTCCIAAHPPAVQGGRSKQHKLEQVMLTKFVKNESGATAIEYALIASLVALGLVTGMTDVGTTLNASFTTMASYF